MPNPDHNSFHPEQSEQSLVEIEQVLESARPALLERLEKLPHAYHNKKHAEEVVQNMRDLLNNLAKPDLFTDIEKALLVECAWRHDDGHAGHKDRQDIADDGLINEEYAVKLLNDELLVKLDAKYLEFMEENILATAVGPGDQNNRETPAHKLLALADVGGFTKSFEEWVDDGMRLLDETPPVPFDWIAQREKFVDYLTTLLDSCEKLLKPVYFSWLKAYLDDIKESLLLLSKKSAEGNKAVK